MGIVSECAELALKGIDDMVANKNWKK